MARAEEDLARAVTVSVISDEPLAAVEEVAVVIAARIDVAASSLVLRRLLPHVTCKSFLAWPWLSIWLGCGSQ